MYRRISSTSKLSTSSNESIIGKTEENMTCGEVLQWIHQTSIEVISNAQEQGRRLKAVLSVIELNGIDGAFDRVGRYELIILVEIINTDGSWSSESALRLLLRFRAIWPKATSGSTVKAHRSILLTALDQIVKKFKPQLQQVATVRKDKAGGLSKCDQKMQQLGKALMEIRINAPFFTSSAPTSKHHMMEELFEEIDEKKMFSQWAAQNRDQPVVDEFADLKPVIKDVRTTTRKVSTEAAVLLRRQLGLEVRSTNSSNHTDIPAPVETFEEGVEGNVHLLEQFRKNNFTKPSPVQCQMWPILLKGIDCVGISQTGSGKTLAFLVPAFLHCDAQLKHYAAGEKRPCPSVLVLTPTRELALQIHSEVQKYSYNDYKSVCLYGGAYRGEQIATCANGVEIAIATPGRLADLASQGSVCLKTVTYVVLDEADRMLDLGFDADIRRIMLEIRPDRVTVLTSATWPETVSTLSEKYLKNSVICNVGTLDLTACKSVRQYFEWFEDEDFKKNRLEEVMSTLVQIHDKKLKLLVFVSQKVYADHVASDLIMIGVNAQALHSGRSQQDRENTLKDFRTGRVRVLIATDLASRGIDVPDVTHVINYDFPSEIEEYVHRVGRTGRAGKKGEALTFVTYRSRFHLAKLIDILEKSDQIWCI
ncbi:unnamed protein product, partial [Mesorhabditis belari]|uniref:RNA helicase n=1 Tax=Mesorhabditis belari TaxID=2138241 RepID=A0AAF3FC41_9BILA